MGRGRGDSPLYQLEAELSFPISDKVALWASWNTRYPQRYLNATPETMKELNRRTAKIARRFIYAKFDAHWIMQLCVKKMHRLNRLR